MNNKQLAEIARIIGVSEDSITAMEAEIRQEMAAVLADITDEKAVYEKLDALWQKGAVEMELHEISQTTGIPFVTLRNLDSETQQTVVYDYLMDPSRAEHIYQLVNKALSVAELDKVAAIVAVSARELRKLSHIVQERICGAYAMEYDEHSTNAELTERIREMITT